MLNPKHNVAINPKHISKSLIIKVQDTNAPKTIKVTK